MTEPPTKDAAIALALSALRTCVTGGYVDTDGDWQRTYRYDRPQVAAAIDALAALPAQEAAPPMPYLPTSEDRLPRLPPEEMDAAFQAMHDGLHGFQRTWGYRQFAEEIVTRYRRLLCTAPRD